MDRIDILPTLLFLFTASTAAAGGPLYSKKPFEAEWKQVASGPLSCGCMRADGSHAALVFPGCLVDVQPRAQDNELSWFSRLAIKVGLAERPFSNGVWRLYSSSAEICKQMPGAVFRARYSDFASDMGHSYDPITMPCDKISYAFSCRALSGEAGRLDPERRSVEEVAVNTGRARPISDPCQEIEEKKIPAGNPESSDPCYVRLAEARKDPSYCEKFPAGWVNRSDCFSAVAAAKGEVQLCLKLPAVDGGREVEARQIARCAARVAKTKKDRSVCMAVSGLGRAVVQECEDVFNGAVPRRLR